MVPLVTCNEQVTHRDRFPRRAAGGDRRRRRACRPRGRRARARLGPRLGRGDRRGPRADQRARAARRRGRGAARRRDRHAQARRRRRLAAAQPLRALLDDGAGRHGEDQPAVESDGVEPEQPPLDVDERAAGGAAREWRGVLDRAADAAAARAAEAAPRGGHEAERRAQAAPAGIGEREHGLPGAHRLDGVGLPGDGRRVAGVDGDDRDVEVGIRARHAAERDLAVGAPHGDLLAAQHVRVGHHDPGCRDDPRAAPPPTAEPDDRRPDRLGRSGDRILEFCDDRHFQRLRQ